MSRPDLPQTCAICEHGAPRFSCQALLYPGCERAVVECPECGAAYYWPIPEPEDISKCYPHAYFKDFFKQYWKDYYKGRMLAQRIIPWRPQGTMIDVGCALGTFLAGVRDHSRWHVLGMEYAPSARDVGRELNNVEIHPGGLTNAPWPDQSADYIHINNVLEHEAAPVSALERAARLLKPGGRIHLTIPNGPVDLMPTRDLYKRWGRAVTTRHGGHLFFLSRKALGALFERVGLRTLSIRNFHFKLGFKARGWLPRAYKPFEKTPPPPPKDEGAAGLSPGAHQSLIGPRTSWPLYYFRSRLRRFWRWPGVDFGYDYEILAERRP